MVVVIADVSDPETGSRVVSSTEGVFQEEAYRRMTVGSILSRDYPDPFSGAQVKFLIQGIEGNVGDESVRQLQLRLRTVLEALSPQAGLEEAPASGSPLALELPGRFIDFDGVKAIQDALKNSFFLKTIAQMPQLLLLLEGAPRGYRRLTPAEQKLLEQQGVRADSWNSVAVPEQFGVEDINRISNVTLRGTVQLGLLRGRVPIEGTYLDSQIRNTVLADTAVGNGVLIKDNQLIQGYRIGDGALVFDNGLVTADPGTTFGLGAAIPVGLETGGPVRREPIHMRRPREPSDGTTSYRVTGPPGAPAR
jgi:hypothetical protein